MEPKIPEDEAAVEESFAPKRSEANEEPDCFPPSILSVYLFLPTLLCKFLISE